jgi:hypothetical protein
MKNSGIIVNDHGQFKSHQTAVGENARVINGEKQTQKLLVRRINRLLDELESSDLPEKTTEVLLNAALEMKREAKKANPDKSFFEKSLAIIEKTAPTVAAIASAGKGIQELVSAWTTG